MSFAMSVRLYFRMEQLGSHWGIFMKFDIWGIFLKSVGKIQVSLRSDKNNEHFTCKPIYISNHISLVSS